MKNINLSIKDSPLSILLISMLFISLGYLVYLHPEEFEGFFKFIIVLGFVILTGLLFLWYTPFKRLNDTFINLKSKTVTVKDFNTYHKDVEDNTKQSVNKLMQSEQYKKYLEIKQQNPNQPVVLCNPTAFKQAEQATKDFQEMEKEIFDQETQIIQENPL